MTRRAWILTAGIVALLGVGAVGLRVRHLAREALADLRRQVEALRAVGRARADAPRPVLEEEASPGSAWEDYAKALDAMRTAEADPEALHAWLEGERAAPPPNVAALLERVAPALEHLRRGAARRHGRFRYELDAGAAGPQPDVVAILALVDLARGRARVLDTAGDRRGAVAWLLRGCQLGRDLADGGTLLAAYAGLHGVTLCLAELGAMLAERPLADEDAVRLEERLAELESALPASSEARRHELVWIATNVLAHPELLEGGAGLVISSWRYVFSQSLMLADGWNTLRRAVERVDEAQHAPWPRARAVAAAAALELRASTNPLVRLCANDALLDLERSREVLARIRLLRAALAWTVRGASPDLGDPFGERLRLRAEATAATLWSVGPDGRDDGGRGSFRARDPGPDLVLRVRR